MMKVAGLGCGSSIWLETSELIEEAATLFPADRKRKELGRESKGGVKIRGQTRRREKKNDTWVG
jgi:hypothetical protein